MGEIRPEQLHKTIIQYIQTSFYICPGGWRVHPSIGRSRPTPALQKEAPSAKSMTDEAPRKHYLYYNNYIFIPNLKRLTAKNVEVVTPVRLKRTTFRTGI